MILAEYLTAPAGLRPSVNLDRRLARLSALYLHDHRPTAPVPTSCIPLRRSAVLR